MTVQEVIDYLRMATDEAEDGEFSDIYRDMCDMSIKALEKQIPKKPIYKEDYFECPICGAWVLCQEYCNDCGQAIDWEEGGTSDC